MLVALLLATALANDPRSAADDVAARAAAADDARSVDPASGAEGHAAAAPANGAIASGPVGGGPVADDGAPGSKKSRVPVVALLTGVGGVASLAGAVTLGLVAADRYAAAADPDTFVDLRAARNTQYVAALSGCVATSALAAGLLGTSAWYFFGR